MAFPQNRQGLEEALRQEEVVLEINDWVLKAVKGARITSIIERRRKAIEILLRRFETIQKETLLIIKVLRGLLDGWRYWDIDVPREEFYALTVGGESAVIAEYIPEGFGICVSEEEWTTYLAEVRVERLECPNMLPEKVPYVWVVTPLADISLEPCPTCGESQPMIEQRTVENMFVDLFAICLSCHSVYRCQE
ncbi:MAG: hypothetical protein G01um101466_469 [Parcubacteria group bacterium Gr01-1014_66]|nr:MAG: hypothetical protein G01um101466_469 [Parcubacteria group bacterium Gr01-1014_66]